MVRVLLVCVAMLLAWQPVGGATAPGAGLFAPFDPAALAPAERRLLQSALAAAGVYDGPLDGLWGAATAEALGRFAGGSGAGEGPTNLDAAALATAFLDEVRARGWDFRPLDGLGVSMALPFAELGSAEDEAGDTRRWSRDGRFTVLTRRSDRYEAATWHDAAMQANADDTALATVRAEDLLVTRGVLRDGRLFYTRSDRAEGGWTTVYLAADAVDAGTLALAAASVRPGRPLPWTLPEGGELTALVAEARAVFAIEAGAETPRPLAATAPAVAAPPQAEAATTSGTAFYLGARTLVTAGHVVAACDRVNLADGTDLEILASDPDLDVAVLATPRPAGRWLSLAAAAPARLGQRVHAAGFPYYAIAGTSLHLTGGNVSALAGIDDDARFFSFTAPVQPGNSGGPLLDADGDVLGLVVARLSEDFIVEETGSFPQNVNYAVSERELADFLARAGVVPSAGGLDRFDMDEGVPDGFAAAVVPIVCH
jgi:hypothetical protein